MTEQLDYEKVLEAILRQTPRQVLANASAGFLWRAVAAVFTFFTVVGGAGVWIGDKLASSQEASLNFQIDTLKKDLEQAHLERNQASARANKLEDDKRHDEVFPTYLRYLMSLHGLGADAPDVSRCQFIKLQVQMFENQLGLNPNPDYLRKIFGANYEDASVPVEP